MAGRKDTVKAIKHLYRLSSFLGQVPPYDFDKRQFKTNTWDLLRALVVTGLIFAGYINYMLTLRYATMGLTTVVVVVLVTFTFAASQIYAVLSSSFWNLKKWRKMMSDLVAVEEALGLQKPDGGNIMFYTEVIIGHIYCMATIVYNVSITLDSFTPQQVILVNVLIYYIFVSSMVNYNFALCLKYRYAAFNATMDGMLGTSVNLVVKGESGGAQIKRMWGLYTTLDNISENFNEIFGFDLLFLSVNIVATMLRAFDSAILMSKSKAVTDEDLDDLVIINSLTGLMFLVFGIVVIVSYDMVTFNAKRTTGICYKILLETRLVPKEREDLSLFAQQTVNVDFFTAAGFFEVDISLLLSILGVVASNLIIIIQLNQ